MRTAILRVSTFYIAIICWIFLIGCNFSDEVENLPGGHTYVNEGRCYKFILVNIKNGHNIESCVSDYKFDDNYITVAQIDELKCNQSAQTNKEDKKFFIIDNKNEKLLGPFSYTNFKAEFDKLQISKKLFLE